MAVQTGGHLRVKDNYRYRLLQKIAMRLCHFSKGKVRFFTLSAIPGRAPSDAPVIFMFGACILNQIYLFQNKSL
jgi:hypothetical protein